MRYISYLGIAAMHRHEDISSKVAIGVFAFGLLAAVSVAFDRPQWFVTVVVGVVLGFMFLRWHRAFHFSRVTSRKS